MPPGKPSEAVVVRRRVPEELLRTAERLLATYGIDGVSLRQIALEAGQRNQGVVQYHFGSKDGLVRAIIEYRHPPINRRQLQLLEQLKQQGQTSDIRGLVEAMTRPLLEMDPEAHFVPFLARLSARWELYEAYLLSDQGGEGSMAYHKRLRTALKHLPQPVLENRIEIARDMTLNAIANRQSRAAAGSDLGLTDQQFADELYNAAAAIFCAERATQLRSSHRRMTT
jgi:AcrR family transcriptional regulator